MLLRRQLSMLGAAAILVAACSGGGATPAPTTAPTQAPESMAPESMAPESMAPESMAPESMAPESMAPATPIPGGLLDKVLTAGNIVMSTDPQYPPQSVITKDGTYEGFDIDVGTEIAKRLGVTISFETPDWDALTAGSWSGRWDFSVGSMTITTKRQEVLDFTIPYYYTPAQMAARADTGITTLEGLAGKTICVGKGTTYLEWLKGTLDFGTESPQTAPPAGVKATTLKTDRQCAEAWKAGRKEAAGWLSSSTTVQAAIDDGLPVVAVGAPVFYEPLAAAFDKSGPDPTDMVAKVNQILQDMHDDGTLSAMSMKWFGEDLTIKQGG